MTLAFRTHWPKHMGNTPTWFIPKIWISIRLSGQHTSVDHVEHYHLHNDKFGHFWDEGWDFTSNPKQHTIRQDASDRWKESNLIHPVINNRTPQRFQFAPPIKCTGIQKIEIGNPFPTNPNYTGNVWIDGRKLNSIEMHNLAINDGFDSVEQFFQWFNTDFTGKIIHWTDLKY